MTALYLLAIYAPIMNPSYLRPWTLFTLFSFPSDAQLLTSTYTTSGTDPLRLAHSVRLPGLAL